VAFGIERLKRRLSQAIPAPSEMCNYQTPVPKSHEAHSTEMDPQQNGMFVAGMFLSSEENTRSNITRKRSSPARLELDPAPIMSFYGSSDDLSSRRHLGSNMMSCERITICETEDLDEMSFDLVFEDPSEVHAVSNR